MSDGSRHSIAYVQETVFGQTPATPTFKPFRGGRTQLGLNKDSIQSEELRNDRQIADLRHGTKKIDGPLPFELSFGSFDDFLEAVLCGTWTANRLDVGLVRRSFTIERYFSDLQSADKPYHRYLGCELNSLELKIAPNAMVTGSFGVMGQDIALDTAAITGSDYDPATTTSPYDTFTGVINEGGSATGIATELSFTLDNGMESRFVAFSDKTIRHQIGRSSLSGALTAYFESSALYEKFIDETESSLSFTLGDGGAGSYIFTIPRVKYTAAGVPTENEGAIFVNLDWQALLDDVESTNFYIQRVV